MNLIYVCGVLGFWGAIVVWVFFVQLRIAGTLVVVLKRIANFINYLTRDDYAFSTHAQAAVHPVALHMISAAPVPPLHPPLMQSPSPSLHQSNPSPPLRPPTLHPPPSPPHRQTSVSPRALSPALMFPLSHCAAAHPPQCHQVKSVDPDFTQYAEAGGAAEGQGRIHSQSHRRRAPCSTKCTWRSFTRWSSGKPWAVGEQTLNRSGATHSFPLHSAVRLTMPPSALQAIDRELRAEEAAADGRAQEEAAVAHKKVGHTPP